MSTIFPGNYIAHLNAYREQGVVAIPGVEFYRGVGALVLNPDNRSLLVDGVLPADTYSLVVLSPDLRQDDKPRVDRPFVVPAGSVVRALLLHAVSAVRGGQRLVTWIPSLPPTPKPMG